LHVISAAGHIDHAFLAAHAEGWEEIERQLPACTPAWGEATTGVPARLIEQAALVYAAGPSLLWMGQGFQRQSFGGNAMRAVALLPAATGNLGRYGAGFLYLNGWDTRGVDADYLTAARLKPDSAQTISHMDLASRLEAPATKAIVTWNNNIAVSSPEQKRLRRALERDDLLQVTLELFQTDTANYADYVLPAASFLEFDDVVMSYFDASISAQAKAIPSLGEALPNQEIFRRLAAAMGLTEPELFETDADLIATLLDQAKPGLTFDRAGRGRHDSLSGRADRAIRAARLSNTLGQSRVGRQRLRRRRTSACAIPLGGGAPRRRRAAPPVAGIEMVDGQQLRQRPQGSQATRRIGPLCIPRKRARVGLPMAHALGSAIKPARLRCGSRSRPTCRGGSFSPIRAGGRQTAPRTTSTQSIRGTRPISPRAAPFTASMCRSLPSECPAMRFRANAGEVRLR
jgi:hypothetical protein